MRAGVAVQHSKNVGCSCIADDRAGIVLGFSGVNDDRLFQLARESNLSRKGRALGFAGRVVVVIVEAALADRHGRRVSDNDTELWNVARGIERCRVVRVDPGSREDEPSICGGNFRRERCRGQRFTNADDRSRARFAGAGYYLVAVAAEGRVREVGVAVDEGLRATVLRGHLRSIQRSTGAAT